MAPTWVQLGGEGCVTIEVVMIVWRTVGGDYDEWVMKCGELTGKKERLTALPPSKYIVSFLYFLTGIYASRKLNISNELTFRTGICLKKAEYIK